MKCNYCELRCELDKVSLCSSYFCENGEIKEKEPFEWTTCHTATPEEIPLFHYYPRRKLLELGGARCNAACSYCMNARVVDMGQRMPETEHLDAERVVRIAEQTGCSGIHFGINEVTVNLPSALAIAQAAHKKKFCVGASTNGYMTEETAALMAESFDYLNISIKSLSDEYYRRVIGLPGFAPVKRNIEYFADKLHLEITMPIVQNMNDDEIMPAAKWLAGINKNLPLHIFRLLPEHKMEHDIPPDVNELTDKILEARKILPYIYFSNFAGSRMDDTVCPNCGKTLIKRLCTKSCGAVLADYELPADNKCPYCHNAVYMEGEPAESVKAVMKKKRGMEK